MAGKAAAVWTGLILLLLGLAGAGSGYASSVPVAPVVGSWEYSHVRCATTTRGFTDEAAAQSHGITFHYNACGDARLFEAGHWGTLEERTYGSCGSWNTYPRLLMGVENMNARRVRVQFCPQQYVDSFTLYRNRSVSCPAGYRAAGNVCMPVDEELNPDKNGGPECPSNGSNPINGATGNKYQREVDLATMPGGLEFVRHYNSYQVLAANLVEPGLPLNWRHNYSRNISWRAGGITTATLSRPDGRAWSFTLTEAGIWQADTDVPGELLALREEGDIVGWTYLNSNNETEHYNADGQLQRIVNPEGMSLTFTHQDGRLAVVTDRYGHQLQFNYYPQGHAHAGLLAELVGPDNARWQYNYDAQANLTGVQYPGLSAQLSVRHYHYNEPAHTEDTDLPHALTGITLENGDRYGTYRYDAAGRAVSSEHGSMQANRTHISYHSDGSRTITDALGKQRQYNYVNRLGVARVTSISEPCSHCGGQSENRTYDTAGRVISRTDFRGHETQYRYEDVLRADLETWRTEAVGTAQQRTIATRWNPHWRQPAERSRPGLFTRWHYQGDPGVGCGGAPGALCRLEQWSTDDADGEQALAVQLTDSPRVTRWQYVPADGNSAAAGRVLSVDGPRDDIEDIERYEYDHNSGYLIATVNALGHRTRYEDHDGWGRARRIIDANGRVTEQLYHQRGWLLRRDVGGALTSLEYDEVGQLVKVVDPQGGETRFDYDDARRLVGIRDADGNRLRYVLNALGEREQEIIEDAQGNALSSLTRQFDQLNRLQVLIDGEGGVTRYDYDAAGNLTSQQSAEQRVTEYQYDSFNRVIKIVDALQGETGFVHDGAGRTSAVVDANSAETRYQYDGFGNLLQQLSADTGETRHEYDAADNRLRTTDARGVTVVYQYDALNRLTSLQYPDSVDDAYLVHDQGANGIGRLSSIEEHGQVLRFDYDSRGNLARQQVETDEAVFTVGYQHDLADRVVAMDYPSGSQVTFQRNGKGQIAGISAQLADGRYVTIASDMRYRGFGGLLELIYGNGIVLSRDYDRADRLIRHTEAPVLDLEFSYDGDGNLLSRTASDSSANDETYQYDPLNRLVNAEGGFGAREYDYDAVGNRLRLFARAPADGGSGSEAVYIYQDASNRLLQAAGQGYQYDAAGNPVQVGDLQHDYDQRGRLQTISRSGELIARYHYSLLGQRTAKIIPGDGAANAEWHRAQAEAAQAEAAGISAQLLALDIEYATAQATHQAAVNLANQYHGAATQSQQSAAALEQQSAARLVMAEQNRAAASEQQRLSDQALASRSDSWFGWLINWWYELRSDSYLAQADRLIAQADQYQLEADTLQQQADTQRQQAEQHLADADTQNQLAQTSLATMASIDNARQQKQIALSEAMALADYHLAQAEQPQAEEQILRFVYNQQGLLIGEYQNNGTPLREYIYRDMTPMALLDYRDNADSPRVFWYHTDQLGTPQVLTDERGSIVWQARYSPFGEVDILVGDVAQPLRFPGQYFDEESGLHYNYFRYYDPAMGRYLRSDPIGLDGGVNTYAYANSDPAKYIDILGLQFYIPSSSALNRYEGYTGATSHAVNSGINGCYGECSKLNSYVGLYIQTGIAIGSGFAADAIVAGTSAVTIRTLCAAGVVGATLCSGRFSELDDIVKHRNLLDKVRKDSEYCGRPGYVQY